MHRLGVSIDEADEFYRELKELPQVHPQLGFVSHFSRADELDSDYTENSFPAFYPLLPTSRGSAPLLHQVVFYFGHRRILI